MRRAIVFLAPLALLAFVACGGDDDVGNDGPTSRPTATLSANGNCQRTINHFDFPVVLPSAFPQDVQLVEACTHEEEDLPGLPPQQIAELIYRNPDETVEIQIATANLAVTPQDREQVDVAGTVGYIQARDRGDGTRTWGIEFEKDGRAYTVIAILGPENQVTEDSIREMAESIATGTPVIPG